MSQQDLETKAGNVLVRGDEIKRRAGYWAGKEKVTGVIPLCRSPSMGLDHPAGLARRLQSAQHVRRDPVHRREKG